jgi:hypothetical protein
MAMTICLYGTVVQSPAANTPGSDVCPRRRFDLAAWRELDVALEPVGVRQQADLHEDAFELDRVHSLVVLADPCRRGR